jgi:putative membrane protein
VRYVYLAIIILLAGIAGLFKLQNLEAVTVSFLSASVTLPASLLVLLAYVLGMLTGSAVFALLRDLTRRARSNA